MKNSFLAVLTLLVYANLSSAQSKSSYPIYNVNNAKKIFYNNTYYDVDTLTATIKTDTSDNIPFKVIRFNKLGYADVKLPSNISFDSAMRIIETNNNISKVIYSVRGEYNTSSTNDNLYYTQWGLRAIKIPQAWDISTGNSSIIVGVIDSGVDWLHPDLGTGNDGYHNFHTNLFDPWGKFGVPSSGNGVDDDNNGLIDDYLGWNYENNSNDCRSTFFHGTFVAGIISAKTNNNSGIAGIAGGNNSSGVKILPYCVGSYTPISSVIDDAILDAVDKGAKIIQLSLTVPQNDDIDDAIQYAYDKGAVVICATGNNRPAVQYPATNQKVIAVGAIDSNLLRASFSCYDDRNVDVVGPGVSIKSTTLNNTYSYNEGTSFAAPHVSGVAALALSVNPNLTSQQVRDIIESTAQKLNGYSFQPASSNHPNGTWNNEVGYGLVDAYAAVQKAMNYHNDLYVRDTVTDDGTMPSNEYSTWDSPDIWMEDTLGHYVAHPHGNAKYVVCVRIHNRRDVASSGTERLFLNWAKAGFNDKWDEYWTSNNLLPCGAPKGGVIGSANGKIIPSIPANGYRIDTIHWITPAGEDYANCTDFNYDQWHFCLLARIHDDDVIAHENEHNADVHQLVKNHNNVAQQNVYFYSAENYRKTLSIGNVHTIDMSRIICLSPKVIANISITDYAEVYITLDAGLLAAIDNTNISGLTWVSDNTLRWNGGSACIPVTLPANSYYTMMTTVHFLANQIPASNTFEFDIVLRNATGDSILGGEHCQCVRTEGRWFQTCIYRSESVLWGDPVTLTACDIEEDAEYIWYDDQGEEVGYGLTCYVAPLQPTTYTLRVTADEDGYRSYCQLTINVTDGKLRMLAPNPADNQVRIGYALSRNVSSATLQILNGNGQVVHSQVLNGGNGSKVTGEVLCNTSSLAAGSYSVRLVSSKGKVYDSKTLIIN